MGTVRVINGLRGVAQFLCRVFTHSVGSWAVHELGFSLGLNSGQHHWFGSCLSWDRATATTY